MSDSFFSKPLETHYTEPAIPCDFEEFKKVVESRRSVRVFTPEKIPDSVVEECLRLATLAPTSSNLQSWEFYWVESEPKKHLLKQYCLNQPAASTASTLIVCVARPDRWPLGQKINLDYFDAQTQVLKSARDYYTKLVPFIYGMNGPFGIFGPIKTLAINIAGLFRVLPRGPYGLNGNKLWANKTTALACENLMLAFRAAGFDTCPMEGFDEVRVKKLLGLPWQASVTMVISAGKRASKGVYGPRIRGSDDLFIHKV
jgi:nitroreductase